jgi:hypothetical protein
MASLIFIITPSAPICIGPTLSSTFLSPNSRFSKTRLRIRYQSLSTCTSDGNTLT